MRDFDGGFCIGFEWSRTHGSHACRKKGSKTLILKIIIAFVSLHKSVLPL